MSIFKRGTAAWAVTAAVALTGFAGTAGAQQDLRNPDQRAPAPAESALATPSAPADRIHQDLRNADRRAPAVVPPSESTGVSLPPETIDGAPIVQVPVRGFDWGDAGIGAAAGLAVVMLAGAVALLFTQRRRHTRVAA
jgi:hypothetical protein